MANDLHRDSVVVFKCCGVVLLFCAWQFFQQPYAAIPAQDRIIVVGWLNFLRLFKIAHRFFKQPHKNMRGTPGSHLGFGAALMKQAQVVVPLVGIGEPAERAFRFAKTVP